MWDIWYTGSSPFPSELINPAPRPTVVSALLHPHDFVRAHAELVRSQPTSASHEGEDKDGTGVGDKDEDDGREPALWELPDTSIAFRRYLEAGKMVNVYDWFESFAVVLDDQRRQLRRRAVAQAGGATPNGKRKGKSKEKENGKVPRTPQTPRTPRRRGRNDSEEDALEGSENDDMGEDEDDDEEMDDEEEEKWKVEVQARFIRALHELDYMGFVKHTGRKQDHVIRTIYDVPD